jgi:hypothetical protein
MVRDSDLLIRALDTRLLAPDPERFRASAPVVSYAEEVASWPEGGLTNYRAGQSNQFVMVAVNSANPHRQIDLPLVKDPRGARRRDLYPSTGSHLYEPHR